MSSIPFLLQLQEELDQSAMWIIAASSAKSKHNQYDIWENMFIQFCSIAVELITPYLLNCDKYLYVHIVESSIKSNEKC